MPVPRPSPSLHPPIAKNRPNSPAAPNELDASTGLPARQAPIGVSANASPERESAALAFAIAGARCLKDDKCEDVLVIDLRGRSQVTDFFVIASGTSERQMRSAAQHVADLSSEHGLEVYRSNLSDDDHGWTFLDLVDVVVHVLTPESRRYYDIEMLWGDAPRIEWRRESDLAAEPPPNRNRAGLRPGDINPDTR